MSAYPASVTQAMLENFRAGGAAVNQICATYGIGLKVFELALDIPTADITEAPALDEAACAATIAFGMEAIAGDVDVLCLGEMGIGNTTVAAAIYAALYGGAAADWVGPRHRRRRPRPRAQGRGGRGGAGAAPRPSGRSARGAAPGGRPRDRRAGRRDPGRAPAARAGDSSTASSSARRRQCCTRSIRAAIDHCLAAHVSAEQAHRNVLEKLGKAPLLDLGMRLGEGSGAGLALGLLKAALACTRDMATFAEAGVAGKTDA